LRYALCCIALFAGLSPGYAQAPPSPTPAPAQPSGLSITGPTSISEFTQATLTVQGSTGTPLWLETTGLSIVSSGSQAIVTGRPGQYLLTVIGNTPNGLAKATWSLTINPTEKPRFIAVFDPASLTSLPAGQVAIYQSTTIAASLAAQGVIWSQYSIGDVIPSASSDSMPFSQTTWGSKALGVGLPALVTCSQGVISAVPLPANEATIVGMAAQARGAK
jgi:hypothetical protein